MGATPEEVAAGHAFYSRRTLRIYDPMILGFFSRVAWRCPSSRILEHYDRHVSGNHLDVGPGTGYFLDRCRFPVADPRIALLDLNTDCLAVACERIGRYRPQQFVANALEPLEIDTEKFDSVALNYVLHCLPGRMADKTTVFRNLATVTTPGGVIFGATLLQEGVPRSWYARAVMARNNRVGIFSNRDDSLDDLTAGLAECLVETSVEVVGCVAMFSGRVA